MQVTVYGAGYVGLVSAVCLAELGHHVFCVDVNRQKIKTLQQGQLPIFEPDLQTLLLKHQHKNSIHFSEKVHAGVGFGDVQIIAVGTPPLANGAADLSFVEDVAATIAHHMNEYKLIVTKSTVPVGTTDKVKIIVKNILNQRNKSLDFDVASNPEFLREGCAVEDFMHPDRIIVGVENTRSQKMLEDLYQPIIARQHPFITMQTRSAELTKYASNAFLATKISFMNEMSRLAELTGADIDEIRKGMTQDSRISEQFLNPGCGFGGSCFPKDIAALNALAIENGFRANVLRSVMATNHYQQRLLFNKINHYFTGNLKNKLFAIWGLSFKPNTDDVRCATSRVVMELLWNTGARLRVYDPMAMPNIRQLYSNQPHLEFSNHANDALMDASALIIFTEWEEFLHPDFAIMKAKMKNPVIFDGRNLYDPTQMLAQGFTYIAIGRQTVKTVDVETVV